MSGLKSLLPTIVGIGGAMMGLPTWAVALGSGATTAATTGDLGKGIMSGLLSFGLGSAAQELMGAGEAAGAGVDAATQEAMKGGAFEASQLATMGADGAINPALHAAADTGLGMGNFATEATTGMLDGGSASMLDGISQPLADAGWMSNLGSSMAPAQSFGDTLSQNAGSLGRGLTDMGALKSTFIDNADTTTIPILTGASGLMTPDPAEFRQPEVRMYEGEMSGPWSPEVNMPGSQYRPGMETEHDYFPGMAAGGLASLRYNRGGHISGPGTGLSDSVPAVIDEQEPIRVASGEFIVPSDVVSGLGDGSSEAGIARLYDMMDRVRKTRTGTTRQPGPVDPRVMPA